jgi:hypothetical protein
MKIVAETTSFGLRAEVKSFFRDHSCQREKSSFDKTAT